MTAAPWWVAVLAAAGAGAAAGVWWGRRATARRTPPGASELSRDLLPEPALDWFRRSHRARGAWVTEPGTTPNEVRVLCALEPKLDRDERSFLERRLTRARDVEQNGLERLDGGLFIYRAVGGTAAALYLAADAGDEERRLAEADLVQLLDLLRHREITLGLGTSTSGVRSTMLESVDSVGQRLALQLGRLTGGAAIVAAREERQVRIVGVSPTADSRLVGRVVPGESPLARVARGVLEGQALDEEPFDLEAVGDRRQSRVRPVVLPMQAGAELIGAVAIWPAGPDGLGPAVHADVRTALASAAPRLARAAETSRLRAQSTHDPLTDLLNRRALEQEMTRTPGAVGAYIAIDLDEFKKLNDSLGHPAGDAALQHFARIVEQQVREEDRAARTGGEEFGVWLPQASLSLGIRVAERIRVKLSTTCWEWQGKAWPLRASFGVSACPETSRRVEGLAAQADAALYVAKRSGRNRVEAAGAVPGADG